MMKEKEPTGRTVYDLIFLLWNKMGIVISLLLALILVVGFIVAHKYAKPGTEVSVFRIYTYTKDDPKHNSTNLTNNQISKSNKVTNVPNKITTKSNNNIIQNVTYRPSYQTTKRLLRGNKECVSATKEYSKLLCNLENTNDTIYIEKRYYFNFALAIEHLKCHSFSSVLAALDKERHYARRVLKEKSTSRYIQHMMLTYISSIVLEANIYNKYKSEIEQLIAEGKYPEAWFIGFLTEWLITCDITEKEKLDKIKYIIDLSTRRPFTIS